MRLLIISLLLSLIPLLASSQTGRFPNTFSETTTVTNDNFEVYSQKAGNPRRASLNTIKAFMDQDIYLSSDSICITRVSGDTCIAVASIVSDAYSDYDVWYKKITATDTLQADTLLNYSHIVYIVDMSSASANVNIKLPTLPAAPSSTQYDGTTLDFIVDRSSAYSVSIEGEVGFIGSATSQTKDTITANRATRYIVSYRNSNREYTNMCYTCGTADPTAITTDSPDTFAVAASYISLATDSIVITVNSTGDIDMDVSNAADAATLSVLSSLHIDSVDILSINPQTAFVVNDVDQDNDTTSDDDAVLRFNPSNGSFMAGLQDTSYWDLAQTGNYSTRLGAGTQAGSYAELAIGAYNSYVAAASKSSVDANDRVLVVGNGTSNTARSDAFTIYKSGNATLHSGNLLVDNGRLTVDGRMVVNNADYVSLDADSSGVSTTNTQIIAYGAASIGEGVYMAANTAGNDMVMTLKGDEWTVGDGGVDTMLSIKYDPANYFRAEEWVFDVVTALDTMDGAYMVYDTTGTGSWKAVKEGHGTASDTTDGSGDITISHSLGVSTFTACATPVTTSLYAATVHTKTTTSFKVRVINVATGAAVTSSAVTIDWMAKRQ